MYQTTALALNALAIVARATMDERVGERKTKRRLTSLPAVRPDNPVGLRVRRAASRASPTLRSPRKPTPDASGLLLWARATSQAGDRYAKDGQGTTKKRDIWA
jgi:hypothetical protein